MFRKDYIGWVRSDKGGEEGFITARPVKQISNAITTFVVGGIADKHDGLAGTTPHIVYEYT